MSATVTSPATIRVTIDQAARALPLLWPLSTAIAVNPLWDLHGYPVAHAIAAARGLFGIHGYPDSDLFGAAYRCGRITDADLALATHAKPEPCLPDLRLYTQGRPGAWTVAERYDERAGTHIAEQTEREVAKWCAAFVSGQFGTTARRGFFPTWREFAAADPAARRLGLSALLGGLPASVEEALIAALALLGVTGEYQERELAGQLARLPGWAAHAKWRSRWAAPDHPGPALDLAGYLAVRLAYDAAGLLRVAQTTENMAQAPHIAGAVAPDAPIAGPAIADARMAAHLRSLPASEQSLIWLSAYEGHYRDTLLAALNPENAPPTDGTRPDAQIVCCIDVRSEGLRRHLERMGRYETFGFAGFFGVPARVQPWDSNDRLDLCPVLIRPTLEVAECATRRDRDDVLAARQDLVAADHAITTARETGPSAYVLAEASGFALGPLAVFRTLAPRAYAAMRQRLQRRVVSEAGVAPVLTGPDAPNDDEQALYAETALRTMGLTKGFAPLVVLCGHGSTTENNPYGSALDCGACGAARGGTSARLAAAICNRPAIRALLAERGIRMPDDTLFVAAEHDTATDTVTLYDTNDLSPDHRVRSQRLRADLTRAGAALAAERARTLPGARPGDGLRHVADRSADWAQVQPEWGLAGNAAFLIAPRSFSIGVDLARRVFLHSYQPDDDPDGTALETILTGPAVVAHWINAQYYFSTVDPGIFGAGDKTAHNVVAGIGVYQGAGGDLKLGLPRQSVFVQDTPYHEPMRLLIAITAPRERIDAVIGRNTVLQELIGGGWVHLAARDGDRWWLRQREGGWNVWRPATAAHAHTVTAVSHSHPG